MRKPNLKMADFCLDNGGRFSEKGSLHLLIALIRLANMPDFLVYLVDLVCLVCFVGLVWGEGGDMNFLYSM